MKDGGAHLYLINLVGLSKPEVGPIYKGDRRHEQCIIRAICTIRSYLVSLRRGLLTRLEEKNAKCNVKRVSGSKRSERCVEAIRWLAAGGIPGVCWCVGRVRQ